MIIALTGENGVGKTTFAKMLCEISGATHVAIADKVKDSFWSMWPCVKKYDRIGNNPESFIRLLEEFREVKEKLRPELITYAEDTKKYRGTNCWIKWSLDSKLNGLDISGKNIVISDLRFIEEYWFLKSYGNLFGGVLCITHDTQKEQVPVAFGKHEFYFENIGAEKGDLKRLEELAHIVNKKYFS